MTYDTSPHVLKPYDDQKQFPFVPFRPFFDGTTNGTSPMMAPFLAPSAEGVLLDIVERLCWHCSRVSWKNKRA